MRDGNIVKTVRSYQAQMTIINIYYFGTSSDF